MKTEVVNIRTDECDKRICRPSRFGNPFRLAPDAGPVERLECVLQYLMYVLRHPAVLHRVTEFQGKRLGCWCAPKLCHGDVLAALADNDPERLARRLRQEIYAVWPFPIDEE